MKYGVGDGQRKPRTSRGLYSTFIGGRRRDNEGASDCGQIYGIRVTFLTRRKMGWEGRGEHEECEAM